MNRRKLEFLIAAVLLSGCRSSSSVDELEKSTRTLTPGPCSLNVACAFAITTPATLTPAALVLGATSSLKIGDRVTLKETNGAPAKIANVGTGATQIGTDGKLGDIWSRGRVTIADRTVVNGTIFGAVTVTVGNNVTVKAKNKNAFQTVTTSGAVTFPSQNSGDMNLEPDSTGRLSPGVYRSVIVKSRSVLRLATGSYLMDMLQLEPQSTLALDTTAGPIRLYVRNTGILRGNITNTGGAAALTLIYFGTADLSIETPLNGTVIASIAKIDIKSVAPLSGAFFGKSIEVQPGNTITHVANATPPINVRNGRIEAESFDARSSGHTAGNVVDGLSGGAWLLYRGVNFGTPGQFNRIRFNVLAPSGVTQIVVHLDSVTGQIAADLVTVATGAGGYIVQSAELSPGISGVHDAYVVVLGTEAAGIDWMELAKGPSRRVVATQAPRLPPGTVFPDVSGTPPGEQDDAPPNASWMHLPQNVMIPPHSADGVALDISKPAIMLAQVRWKGGPGPVTLQLYDQAQNPVPFEATRTLPADNKLVAKSPALAGPQTINVVVKNDGDVTLTFSLLVGFVPAP